MKEMPLIKTNPYLKDQVNLEKMIFTNVVSSTAIELVKFKPSFLKKLREKERASISVKKKIS